MTIVRQGDVVIRCVARFVTQDGAFLGPASLAGWDARASEAPPACRLSVSLTAEGAAGARTWLLLRSALGSPALLAQRPDLGAA